MALQTIPQDDALLGALAASSLGSVLPTSMTPPYYESEGSPDSQPSDLPCETPDGSEVINRTVGLPRVIAASTERRNIPAPYQCEVPGCGSTFTKKHNLSSQWNCAGIVKTLVYSPPRCPGHHRSHRNERPFRCKWCSKSFTRSWDHKRHVTQYCRNRPIWALAEHSPRS
jgi:hypothetical protein